MKLSLLVLACLFAMPFLPACGGTSEGASSKSRTGRDRGAASMLVAGVPWVGDSAKARINGNTLSLDLVRSETVGNVTTRGQVKMTVPGFEGPGTYAVGGSSMFVVVAVDRTRIAVAAESENGAAGAMKQALGGTEMQLLFGAEVVVTSVDDDEVEGTYEFTPAPGSEDPPLTAGTFRAILR